MSFETTIIYGAHHEALTVTGDVHPNETIPSVVNIVALVPRDKGQDQHSVSIISPALVSVHVTVRHVLQADAPPRVEVEALVGELSYYVSVQAQLADGPPVDGVCATGCTIALLPTR